MGTKFECLQPAYVQHGYRPKGAIVELNCKNTGKKDENGNPIYEGPELPNRHMKEYRGDASAGRPASPKKPPEPQA